MGIFAKKKSGGFADVIRCDEPNYLIWKWHPEKYEEGALKRETAIRTASVIRVKAGEVAVFVYKSKGKMDYIVGPYDESIKTANLPVLSSIIGLYYEGNTPFQAEVFFINLGKSLKMKFGVPYFDVVDPRYTDFAAPVAVRGSVTFKIKDYEEFVTNHQLATFDLEDLKDKICDVITRCVKGTLLTSIKEEGCSLVSLESIIEKVNAKAEVQLADRMKNVFAVDLCALDIEAIEVNKESSSYRDLYHITQEMQKRRIEASTYDYEERLRIQREEGQYAQHMASQQSNLGAYQTTKSAEVGVAGAEALGKMGENGVGNVDMGSSGGFNPMSMMAGMAVGSAVGQNLANTMGNAMNPNSASNDIPPIPQTKYYYAEDDKPVGPFSKNQMIEMVSNGKLQTGIMVWKQGTPNWENIETFEEFKGMFPPKL